MSGARAGRWTAAVSVAAALAATAVVAAVVVEVLRIHSGTAAEQNLTATTVAGDLALAALALTVLGLLAAAVRRTRAAASRREALLADNAYGTTGGRWPQLDQLDLETLGVRPAQAADGSTRAQLPYVPRRLDEQLDEDLQGHRFVLVLGPAICGKSRSTAETAQARLAGRPVVVPRLRHDALSRLVEARAIPAGAVVWLDELEQHLQLGVDAALLQRILDLPEVRVVATMRAGAYELIKPVGGLQPSGRDAVDLSSLIQYTSWDADDRSEAARRLVEFPRIVAALERGTGLSDYVSAGPLLIDRLQGQAVAGRCSDRVRRR